MYNEELIYKPRVLAITKADMIDEELKEMIEQELPDDLPVVFISSVAQTGLTALKDMLWKIISRED